MMGTDHLTAAAAAYPSPPHYPSAPSPGQIYDTSSDSMASSRSPEQMGSEQAAYEAGQDKSPLSLNLGFLKALTDKRTTREGNPPKRRGPKPDSKPALTRRQELNRQAQRTHRERKELYIKALEDEVLRLKEIFTNMSQDKEKLIDENRQLKQVLVQNNISVANITTSPPTSNVDEVMSDPSVGYSASSTGGYGQAFTPPLTSRSTAPSVTSSGQQGHSPHTATHPQSQLKAPAPGQGMRQTTQQQGRGVDMDQAGIDFVLAYDDPTKAYMSPPHH